jgi:hypothetical protein
MHKFRAYHERWGWARPEDISVLGDGSVFVDFRGESGDVVETYTEEHSDLCLVKWTEHHDRHGTEIYGGDILMFYRQLVVVVFGRYAGYMTDWHHGWYVTDNEGEWTDELIPYCDGEVVGNIHEHPERLV